MLLTKLRPISRLTIVSYALGLSLSLSLGVMLSYPITADAEQADLDRQQIQPSKSLSLVSQKEYQQSLYHYFAGKPVAALNQLALSQTKNSQSDLAEAKLFEAGLMIQFGLNTQAEQNLTQLKAVPFDAQSASTTFALTPKSLINIAKMQLAQQELNQGNTDKAQAHLAQIINIDAPYQSQLLLLKQLAYWPSPQRVSLDENYEQGSVSTTPFAELNQGYLTLNHALALIEQQQFSQAEQLLIPLQTQRFIDADTGFWQQLFQFSSKESQFGYQTQDEQVSQQQAVQDYASLILAKLYIQQQRYQEAESLLSAYPQHSPFAESALFLYAYTAHQLDNPELSGSLFSWITKEYPYSQLAWQSVLLVGTLSKQQSVEMAFTRYQEAEHFFNDKIADLNAFETEIAQEKPVSRFILVPDNNKANANHTYQDASLEAYLNNDKLLSQQQQLVANSPWLTKALKNPKLNSLFNQLFELDTLQVQLRHQQDKSQWLSETITLNLSRQQGVAQRYRKNEITTALDGYKKQAQLLGLAITQAQETNNGKILANKDEKQALARIAQSQQIAEKLASSRNTDEELQRLKRVEGVLAWQLQTQLPERLRQHKKQLKSLNTAIDGLTVQSARLDNSILQKQNLARLTSRQQTFDTQISMLQTQVVALKTNTENAIKAQVNQFIEAEQQALAQGLLTSRHQMAKMLEALSDSAGSLQDE